MMLLTLHSTLLLSRWSKEKDLKNPLAFVFFIACLVLQIGHTYCLQEAGIPLAPQRIVAITREPHCMLNDVSPSQHL